MAVVVVTITLLVALMLVHAAWHLAPSRPVDRRSVHCPDCGYDLRGSRRSEQCPECGTSNAFFVVPRTPFTILKLQRLLDDLHDANIEAHRARP